MSLPPENERIFQSLLRRVHLARGFLYGVLFVEDERAVRNMEDRLRDELRVRARPLRRVEVDDPGKLQDQVFAALFDDDEGYVGSRAPLWVIANAGRDDPDWDAARRGLLMRLNEHRGRLEKEFARPLILLLPGDAVESTAASAPDLWHVRGAVDVVRRDPSAALPTTAVDRGEGVVPPPREALPAYEDATRAYAAPSSALARFDRLVASEPWWQRLAGRLGLRRREPPIQEGLEAVDEALAAGRIDSALAVAERLGRYARDLDEDEPFQAAQLAAIFARRGEAAFAAGRNGIARGHFKAEVRLVRAALKGSSVQSADALRRLSIALRRLGIVDERDGLLADASAAYEESLDCARRAVALDPLDSAVARGLAVALNDIGDVAVAEGRIQDAKAAFQEALDIYRRLAAGSSVDALQQDLALSLNKLGQAAMAIGALDEARRVAEESLTISRRLSQSSSRSSDLRYRLMIALDNVGDVALAQGRHRAARAFYDESLALARGFVQDLETSESLRNLSLSLMRTGRVALEMNDLDDARRAFEESVDIDRRRIVVSEGSLAARRDLSASVSNLGDVAARQERYDEALVAYEESVASIRALIDESGESPSLMQSLSTGLRRLGLIAERRQDHPKALEHYQACLALRRRLVQEQGETASSLQSLAVALDSVGDAAGAAGLPDVARAAFVESLEVVRRSAPLRGNTTSYLRDLIIALLKVHALDPADADGTRDACEVEIRPLIARMRTLATTRDDLAWLDAVEDKLSGVSATPLAVPGT